VLTSVLAVDWKRHTVYSVFTLPLTVNNPILVTVFGRPFVKRFALCYQTVVLSVRLVYCGQMVGWIKMKLGIQVVLGLVHILVDGYLVPPPSKGAQPPSNFRPMSVVVKRLDGSRCHLVGK